MKPESSTGILRPQARERHGIVLRYDALRRGLPRYFTGYPCDRGHIAERDTKTQKCVACGQHQERLATKGRAR
jgi:hypothetical protein